jgi:competence protein ComEA
MGLAAAAVLALGAFALAASSAPERPIIELDSGGAQTADASPSTATTDELVVAVSGAVQRPGVYRLAEGSRIGDAIAAAGGYGPTLDAGRTQREINLAALVQDGEQILVPARGDATHAPARGGGADDGSGGEGGGLVDLNAATSAQLEELPGIGPVTAGKIIAGREEQPFASVDDLRSRKLVGAATFDKIKDLVTVR